MTVSATVTARGFSVQHSQGWEIVGFFAMLAAVLLALLVDREWGVFLMLFAIYCAAMR